MTVLQEQITNDTISIEADLDNPFYIWDDESFPCIPSPSFEMKALEEGGFHVGKTLTLSARKFNCDGDDLYSGVYPTAQKTIEFQDVIYRIQSVQFDAPRALLELVCRDASEGI